MSIVWKIRLKIIHTKVFRRTQPNGTVWKWILLKDFHFGILTLWVVLLPFLKKGQSELFHKEMRMIDWNLLVNATGIARAMPLLKVRKSTTIAMKRFKFTTFRGNTGTCSQKGHFQRINDAICLKTHKWVFSIWQT